METKTSSFTLDPTVWTPLGEGDKVQMAEYTPVLHHALVTARVGFCIYRNHLFVHDPVTHDGNFSLDSLGLDIADIDFWISHKSRIEKIVQCAMAKVKTAPAQVPASVPPIATPAGAVTAPVDPDVAAVLAMGTWADRKGLKVIPYTKAMVIACTERGLVYIMRDVDGVFYIMIDIRQHSPRLSIDAHSPRMSFDAHGIHWVELGWARKAVATEETRRIIAQHPDEYTMHIFVDPVVYTTTATDLPTLKEFTKTADIFKKEYARGNREEIARNGAPSQAGLLERSNWAQLVQRQYVETGSTSVLVAALPDPAQDAAFVRALRESGRWTPYRQPLLGSTHFVKPTDVPWAGCGAAAIALWLGPVLYALNVGGLLVVFSCLLQSFLALALWLVVILAALDVLLCLAVQLFVARRTKTLVVRS